MNFLLVSNRTDKILSQFKVFAANCGSEFDVAGSPEETDETLTHKPYTALFLDTIHLPKKNIIDIIRQTRAANPDIPIILITGNEETQPVWQEEKCKLCITIPLDELETPIPVRTLHSIFHRSKAVTQLRLLEERFRNVAETIQDGLVIIEDNEIKFLNQRMQELTGYSTAELQNKPLSNLVVQEDTTKMTHFLDAYHSGSQPKDASIKCWIKRKDGKKRYIHWRYSEPKGKAGHLSYTVTLTDITEQFEKQAALKQSEANYRAIVETQNELIERALPDGTITFANDALCRYFGKSCDEIVGTNILHTILEEDREKAANILKRITADNPVVIVDVRVNNAAGETRWVEWTETGIFGSHNRLVEIQGIGKDITRRKEVEDALAQSEAFNRNLVDHAPLGILYIDTNQFITYANPAFKRIAGAQETGLQLEGKRLSTLSFVQNIDLKKYLRELVANNSIESDFVHLKSLTGKELDLRVYASPFFNTKNKLDGAIVMVVDISEQTRSQKAIERQLVELKVLHAIAQASVDASSEDKLIERATQIMVESFYPDNFGFLIFDKTKQKLIPHPTYRGVPKSAFSFEGSLGEGISGKAAQTRQPVRIDDVRKSKAYLKISKKTRSELAVPLLIGSELIGVINAESNQFGFFKEEDVRLMTTLAGTLASAINRLRAEEAEREQRTLAEALRDTAIILNSTLDIDEIISKILVLMEQVVSIECASIFQVKGNEAVVVAQRGFDRYDLEDWAKNVHFPIEEGTIIGDTVIHGKPIIVPHTHEDPRWVDFNKLNWMNSNIFIPIKNDQRVIGVLSLDSSEPEHFDERTAENLQAFADQVAIAINNAELYQRALQNTERQIALHQVSQAVIAASADPESVYLSVHQAIKKMMTCEAFGIALLEDNDETVHLVYGFDHGKRSPDSKTPRKNSLLSHIIDIGKSMRIDDLQHFESKTPVFHHDEKDPIRSLIIAPLILNQKVIGTISSQSYHTHAFTDDDLQLLEILASYTTVALEKAKLYQEVLQDAQRRNAVYQVSQEIVAASANPEKIYKAIHEATAKLMLSEVFIISLLDPVNNSVKAVYIYDSGKMYPPRTTNTGKSISEKVIASGKTLMSDRINTTLGVRFGKTDPVKSVLAVPLKMVNGKVIGMISTQSYQANVYGEEEKSLLEMLATIVAISLENARLLKEVQRHAENLTAQNEITQDVLQGENLDSTLEILAERITRLLNADGCNITLWNEEEQLPVPAAAYGKQADAFLKLTYLPDEPTMTKSVIKAKRALFAEDIDSSPYISRRISHVLNIRSLLGLPLIAGNQTLGAALVLYRNPRKFTPEEISSGENAASQVSLALAKLRLLDDVRKRANEFEVLHQVATEVSIEQDLDIMLQKIVERVLSTLNIPYGGIYLFNKETNELEMKVNQGMKIASNIRLKIGEGMAGKVAQTRQPLIVRNYQAWKGRSARFEGIPFTSVLEVPMIYQGELIGVLVVNEIAPKTRNFSDNDVRLLSLFASQAAGAIHSSRLFEQTKKRLRELEALTAVSMAMRSAPTKADIPPVVLKQILELVNATTAALITRDSETDEAVIECIQGKWSEKQGTRIPISHTVMKEMFNSTTPKRIGNISKMIQSVAGEEPETNVYAASIPLITQDETLGVINVLKESKTETDETIFSDMDMRLLRATADITANALRRAELHEQTQEHLRRLSALHEIDMTVNASFDLHLVFDILLDRLTIQLNVDAADILLYDPHIQRLTYEMGAGFRSANIPQTDIRLDKGYAGKAAMERRIVTIKNLDFAEEYLRMRGLLDEGFLSYTALPLISKGEIKGVLEIFYRRKIKSDISWQNFLHTLATQTAIAIDNARLFNEVHRSNLDLTRAYDATIKGWSDALELRDMETEGHSKRVTDATLRLAKAMGIPEQEFPHIRRGALLHDIGKMAIPDSILRKPGKLTKDEWEIMHQHPVFAYQLLSKIDYLKPALEIPYYHHEKWDGSGYPLGLQGMQIPLTARIFAVIDVWDALLSDRPYRKAWKPQKVIAYIIEQSGKHFDPEVVKTFLDLIEKGIIKQPKK